MNSMIRKYGPIFSAGLVLVGAALAALFLSARFSTNTAPPSASLSIWLWTSGQAVHYVAEGPIPANWLAQAGIRLYPGDQVISGGKEISPITAIDPLPQSLYLQVQPALPIQVKIDGRLKTLYSSGPSLGDALWQAGLLPQPGDRLSMPLQTPLREGMQVQLTRARSLTITLRDQTLRTQSAADSVGQALAEAGLGLQGLDYSRPAADQPLPDDGKIRVVQVREEVLLNQTTLPFKSSYAPDPNLNLDQRQVNVPGQLGVKVNRQRVRMEDGREVSRQTEAEWVAVQPKDQVIGYGTRAVTQSLNTPDGNISFYRSVTVYATSYSPCRQGYDHCSKSTSSGTILSKGVVAVTLDWYRMFKGARVYIPGYGVGVIGDVGGGIPGTYWIDLGYGEEDFVEWHQNVTLYFLTPAPPNVPALLP